MKRRTGRELAVQSLYHLEMNKVPDDRAVDAILEETMNKEEQPDPEKMTEVDAETARYVRALVRGVNENRELLDSLLVEFLKGWKMDRLSRVDRQILRLAAFELVVEAETPPKVAVNEAIELAKHFGTDESGKFVNGVLGQMIKKLDELKAKAAQEKV
ncbi:transcription antitermination factor NusB [Paenibacillus turpanensis]|uniref:transcription antitermination factor NusB n=1 Tax=Paenibacillus turpanensis TaxID=2689078 RepID=UPI00140BC06F|nr:transcription antitermination factor NusB [Paenibacillus turpanensis]